VAEVDGVTVGVGQPAVVEHLQEQIPDVAVRLLELVQQDDRERLFAEPLDQRVGHRIAPALADDLGHRLRRLELAHVQAHQPIRRAEQEAGQGLGQLGLAGARRAGEQEDADRLGRVGQPGLEHGDAVDHGGDGLVLSHHPRGEIGADGGKVDRRAVVEDVGGKAGHLRHGLGDQRRRHRLGMGGLGPLRRALEHVGDHARRLGRLQVLLAEGERRAPRGRRDDEAPSGLEGPGDRLGQVREFGVVERRERHQLQVHAQRGAHLQRPGRAGRIGLGQQHQPPGGDGRPDLVEHAGRLALVRAAAGQLLQIADAPDHALAGVEFGDGAADAALQLAEIDLPSHQFGGAGLEHPPAAPGQPGSEQAQKAGLAHPRPAGDQHRARRDAQHGLFDAGQLLRPRRGLDQQIIARLAPHPAEPGQPPLVQPRGAPGAQVGDQGRGEGVVDGRQEGLDLGRLDARPAEGVAEPGRVAQRLARAEVVAEALDQHAVVGPPVHGDGRRLAHRGPLGEAGQIPQHIVQAARRIGAQLSHDRGQHLLTVRPRPQRLERGAGEDPEPPGRVLPHEVEVAVRRGHQRDGATEVREIEQLAGMGGLLGLVGQGLGETLQLFGDGGGLGRRRGGGRLDRRGRRRRGLAPLRQPPGEGSRQQAEKQDEPQRHRPRPLDRPTFAPTMRRARAGDNRAGRGATAPDGGSAIE